jgi:hypothetical protein
MLFNFLATCAQCRIPMVVVRGEPQPNEPATICGHLSVCSMRTDRAQNDEVDADE